MPTCKRCGEAYDPESKSACASGLCPGAEITNLFWMDGACYVNHLSWPHKKALMTWMDGKTYIAPYIPKPEPAPRPDPDNLMRLLTSLERRLLDTECGYIELEQGLSVQEEEGRKLREQVNSQWVQIDRLREQAEPVARDEAEDKAGCCCGDYEAMWNHWTEALEDAAEAAAEYHAAWQDAQYWAIYWQTRYAVRERPSKASNAAAD